jgi:signal transduction histidine kinase
MPKALRPLLQYAITVAALAMAVFLRWLADPLVGSRIPFATILGAVAVAVGVGGLSPALFAIVFGYLATRYWFVEPRHTLRIDTPGDWITLAGYLFACGTVTLFGLLMRRAHQRQAEAAAALRQLNERKDAHLATVAHELRNPLAPIRNVMEALKAQSAVTGRDVRLASDMIDRQLGHLTRLIDDLVDLDRITRNQLELRRAPVSLNTIVGHAVAAVRTSVAAHHHDLVVTLPMEPLMVEADADRIEQVVVNLLSNAVKFTPVAGRIELIVAASEGQATIRIKDTGSGISAEAMPRIFELFYQADRTQRGLGIGLALVRQLVSMHGGTVTAASRGVGQGSEFVVQLPLSADQGVDTSHAASHPAPLGAGEPAIVG